MSMPQPSLATLLLVALNVGLYLRPLGPPENTCLSMQGVWDLGQWQRLFLAPFHHLGWGHLGLNMGALLWLGGVLEARVGSAQAGWLLGAMTLLGGLVHLGLNAGLAALRGDSRHWKHCAVGFSGKELAYSWQETQESWLPARRRKPGMGPRHPALPVPTFVGVIFSLEAMEGFLEPITIATMGSITITTKWLCLAECLTVSLLYPRSSLTGHLSGLLVGLVLAATPLFTSL
nr:rhomboid-related protein 4-like isoform X2 [Pelodiscus sinensis]|eukprot:XP_025036222.1 rhomboid-related protein 4-like isoform X2 [Pelodiscus sinensis]